MGTIDPQQIREQLGWDEAERTVPTGSMWPTIRAGDSIRFRRSSRGPRAGEIWVAERGPVHVVHRVLWVRADGAVLLKGDFTAATDGWLTPAQLFGPLRAIRSGTAWRPTNRRRDRVLGLAWSATATSYLLGRHWFSARRRNRPTRID